MSWVLRVTTGARPPGHSPTGPEQHGVVMVAESTSSLRQVKVVSLMQGVQLGTVRNGSETAPEQS